MPLSPKSYTFLCGVFAALGSVTFGYDLGIIASVLPSDNFRQTTGYPSDTKNGLIASLMLLGAFASNIWVGGMADAIGRRKTIIVGTIIFLIGGTLQTAAQNLSMMLGGRFITGMGIGMLAMLAPLYQAEIAHPSIRGRLTTLQQFMLGVGALIASFIGYGCFHGLPGRQAQWRVPLAIQMVPAVPLGLFILMLPESPRWLMMKGRLDESLATLARLHASGDENDLFVRTEFEDIKASVEKERLETKDVWVQLFTQKANFRRLMLGVILQFSVQMTGVSVIQYFSPQIFASIGIGPGKTLLLQSFNSIIALIGEAFCILLVDRWGRRWPLIVGNIASSITFVVGTCIIAIYPASKNNHSASNAFVAMTWIFNFFFSSMIGPLSWAYPVEIFNSATRARATAITSSAAWISNFMIAQASPPAFAHVGWKYYLTFAICGFSNAFTMWALFPETKGRKLEEMDNFFRDLPWFVPFAKYEIVDRHAREEELRHGEAHLHEGTLEAQAPVEIEKFDSDEKHIE